MRFSRPITTSRLRRPMSPSMHTTLPPRAASATAILAQVVVLPTPPLPEVMVRTLPVIDPVSGSSAVSRLSAPRAPALGYDAPFANVRHLGFRLALMSRRGGDQVCDPQLRRGQVQGTNNRFHIAPRAGVHGAAQPAPHHHIAVSHNLRTGVHIADHDHVAGVPHTAAGAQSAPQVNGL